MAGINVGELFVSLGFDVDDKTLKSFDAGIKDTMSSILKLAGVTATIGGTLFEMKGATDTAIQLRNLNTELGLNQKSVTEWAAAWKYANPGQTLAQGAASLEHLKNYLNDVQWNGKSAGAYNLLGGIVSDGLTVEEMNDQVRKGLPNLIATRGRATASNALRELYGSADAMNVLTLSLEKFNEEAKKAEITPEQVANMVEMRSNLSELGTQWEMMWVTVTGTISPFITNLLKEINSKGVGGAVASFNETQNERGRVKRIIGWDASPEEVDAYIEAHKTSSDSGSGTAAYWASKGLPRGAISALMAQEQAESSGNPLAKNAGHYGSVQWSEDRARNILANTGYDVRKDTDHQHHLEAAFWELQNMGLLEPLKSAGTTSSSAASRLLSKKFEMHEAYTKSHGDETAYRAALAEKINSGDIKQNNTIVIHTNDLPGALKTAKEEFNGQISSASTQYPQGAY